MVKITIQGSLLPHNFTPQFTFGKRYYYLRKIRNTKVRKYETPVFG